MIEVFKTSIECQCAAKQIDLLLTERYPDFKINFDLEDCDRILRIEAEDIPIQEVLSLVKRLNIKCEVLK